MAQTLHSQMQQTARRIVVLERSASRIRRQFGHVAHREALLKVRRAQCQLEQLRAHASKAESDSADDLLLTLRTAPTLASMQDTVNARQAQDEARFHALHSACVSGCCVGPRAND